MTREEEEEIKQVVEKCFQGLRNLKYSKRISYAFMAGYELAASHPVNQWHKTKEFPPEDPKHKGWSVKVIVINDGQYEIGFYDYKLKRWCVPGCINPYFTNITHWQTFPELPKEK